MNVETPPEEQKSLEPEIKQLRQQLVGLETKFDSIREAALKRYEETGDLIPVPRPKQPGWEDAPALRKALRNMRGPDGIAAWYRYSRESFNYELLVETIMQGVWSDVRKSEKFDSGFKEEMRVKKRQYVMYSGDLSMGFDPNITKRLHAYAPAEMDQLRRDANDRLMELGPEKYYEEFDEPYDDEKGRRQVSIGIRYRHFIERYNKDTPEDPIADSLSPDERKEVLYGASQTMYEMVLQNLADDEFTLMPGSLRDLHVVMRNMSKNQLEHYRDRDLDVKIPMVEFFIEQFRDELLDGPKASKNNLELFSWFVNEMGKNFIPFNEINPELSIYWEIIKSLLGRPKDARGQPSIFPYLQDEDSGGNNSRVMHKINELREKAGKSPITMDQTPFARIGVTTGYAKKAR